jgi:phospholipase/lecithinase/hemolysin
MRIRIGLACAAALLLAACGGGNPAAPTLATVASVNAQSSAPTTAPAGGFKQLVVFGDSLSDDGAYTLAAISTYSGSVAFTGLPYAAGGQFTVNGAPTGNWTGVLATQLGLGLTPNLIGYAGNYLTAGGPTATATHCAFSAAQPPSSTATCTNFAQGGAMVSNPIGIGHAGGALTVPVTTQLSTYLSEFNNSFNVNQLVVVLAGNNDIFTALSNVSANMQLGMTQGQAVAVAQASVGAAADQLASAVQTILADGGKYVLVYTLPDSSLTPFGQSLSGHATCNNQDPTQPCYLLSNLVQVFNQELLTDLQGKAVHMIDGFALLNSEIASPSNYGLTNVTAQWCDPATTSSLLCNLGTPNTAVGASDSDLGTWLFADDVHPTPTGYQIIANATHTALQGFGWVN